VGLFDILRGERKPAKPDLDRLFALSTAQLTLVVNLRLVPTGVSGVCFRPVEMSAFDDVVSDLDELLKLSGAGTGTRAARRHDDMGFEWIVLEDGDFEDLVTATHEVNLALRDNGFGEQLLCSVFGFRPEEDGDVVYLVYSYKRGAFYPFVPTGEKTRDTTTELRLLHALKGELPMEEELERWFPLWNHPATPER
jgi:hypothetical protein